MRTALQLSLLTLAAHACSGYIRNGYTEAGGTFVPYIRTDASGIQYYINDQIKAGQTSAASGKAVTVITPGSDPIASIRAAMGAWNSISGAPVRFLPLKTTSSGPNLSDAQMTIAVAASADELSLLQGRIAITVTAHALQKGVLANGTKVDKGDLVDTDILLNPALSYSTDGSTANDLQAVVTHEFGHALGADHSPLLGATMFPFAIVGDRAVLTQRLLSSDDIAFANAVYGAPAASGTVSGRITKADGSAVKAALITLIDRTAGNTIGALTGNDGTWSVAVPAGKYIVYAEPFGDAVSAGNIISLDTSQVTAGFQTSVLGGALTPTEVTVATGGETTGVNITVGSSTGALTGPFAATGRAAGSGDILNVNSLSQPLVIPSGAPFDFAIVGGGVDASTQLIILGQGISVRSGSTHVDPVIFRNGQGAPLGPLVRSTVDTAARPTPSLATVMLVKGGDVLASSGLFVMVPPKPAFVSKGVVNSASYQHGADGNGAVSPGGVYTIFSSDAASPLGPPTLVPGAFDEYGKLASSLGGVTVTFDGIRAPLFYALDGQVSLQVPFELSDRASTTVQVTWNGSASIPVQIAVVPSQPAFFTLSASGGPDAIAGNQDGTFNSEKNPEARGRVVVLYGTGIGAASYPIPTGERVPAPPAGFSAATTCTFNGTQAVAAGVVWTPSLVGLAQWGMLIPQDSPTGVVKVECKDARGATTPPGTLYIK